MGRFPVFSLGFYGFGEKVETVCWSFLYLFKFHRKILHCRLVVSWYFIFSLLLDLLVKKTLRMLLPLVSSVTVWNKSKSWVKSKTPFREKYVRLIIYFVYGPTFCVILKGYLFVLKGKLLVTYLGGLELRNWSPASLGAVPGLVVYYCQFILCLW